MLLDELTSEQLSEWQAYNTLDPIGDWTNDFRLARLSALIVNTVNAILGKKGTYKIVSASEFMPDWNNEKPHPDQQSAEEMKETLMNIAGVKKKKDSENG